MKVAMFSGNTLLGAYTSEALHNHDVINSGW